jgi:hypothetical protein
MYHFEILFSILNNVINLYALSHFRKEVDADFCNFTRFYLDNLGIIFIGLKYLN